MLKGRNVEVILSYAKPIEGLDAQKALTHLETTAALCNLCTAEGTPESKIKKVLRDGNDTILETWSVTVEVCCDSATVDMWLMGGEAVINRLDTSRIEFIDPEFVDPMTGQVYLYYNVMKIGPMGCDIPVHIVEACVYFMDACNAAIDAWNGLRHCGASIQQLNAVLPMATAHKFTVTTTLRRWKRFFDDHRDQGRVIDALLKQFNDILPFCSFGGINKKRRR